MDGRDRWMDGSRWMVGVDGWKGDSCMIDGWIVCVCVCVYVCVCVCMCVCVEERG